MKSIIFSLSCVSLLVMTGQACSQDNKNDRSKRPLNNPMYSTHNYKHPGMAADAHRWENKKGLAVKAPQPGDAQLANYKNQVPTAQPVGGITVAHTPSTNLADRNYKIQRINEPTPVQPANEYIVKKQKRKKDSTATGE